MVLVLPDVLEVTIERVHCCEDDCLVGGHVEDDGLGEEDPERALACVEDSSENR